MLNRNFLSILTVLGAAVVMMGCAKTKNSGTSSPTAASSCTSSWDGTMRDQYGRVCSNYATNNGSCVNTRYNASTGQYQNIQTGQVVNCQSQGYVDGFNSLPVNGQIGGQQISGCAQWSQAYGAQYIPIDAGNGQLVCMNTAYLQQYNPSYNWNQYAAQQIPLYTCSGWDCGGSYYGGNTGYNYGCSTSINLGVSFGNLFGSGVSGGVGAGICLPGI